MLHCEKLLALWCYRVKFILDRFRKDNPVPSEEDENGVLELWDEICTEIMDEIIDEMIMHTDLDLVGG